MTETTTPPIRLSLMCRLALAFAEDIELEQDRYVQMGIRRAVDPMELEKARVLRAIAQLLERLRKTPAAAKLLGISAPKKLAEEADSGG